MSKQRLAQPYFWSIIIGGGLICLFSILNLPATRLDLRFLLLSLATILLTSRLIIRIPRFTSQISVSDTLILLTLLLYGGETAILLAAAEALSASLRFNKKKLVIAFNSAMAACCIFLTAAALRFSFGKIEALHRAGFSAQLIKVVCLMAIVHYASNSILVAIYSGMKNGQSIWHTWKLHYLWASIAFFAAASAAGFVSAIIDRIGFYAVLVTTPIIAIVYFTYRTYLKNIEVSAMQAEQAQRHVEELSHYIAEQERLREQFGQLEKLSALGELASGVAHDFNNTLAGILGRAQLLLRTNDQERIKRGLNIIIKAAEDGAKTVKRIQDFARQRRDHDFMLVAVDQLLSDVSEITRPRWKDQLEAANVHIDLEVQTQTKALVMGDDSELRDVLVNMVLNAVDAMPGGGKLRLKAEEDGDCVLLSVSDTGVGMSAEVRSRIFDPFFTTKGKAGMGLGLAVSYGIIRRHEGSIEVESEIGRGTTFRIKLPIALSTADAEFDNRSTLAASSSLTGPAANFKPDKQHAPVKILIVDDEEYVCELLHDILIGEGCEVVMANGGHEAIAAYDTGRFDAIFTDLGMPGMSGWEFAQAIRERNSVVPIAVITGWGEAVGSNEQKAAQVDWVVTKPFSTERVAELAREITRRRPNNPHNPFPIAA